MLRTALERSWAFSNVAACQRTICAWTKCSEGVGALVYKQVSVREFYCHRMNDSRRTSLQFCQHFSEFVGHCFGKFGCLWRLNATISSSWRSTRDFEILAKSGWRKLVKRRKDTISASTVRSRMFKGAQSPNGSNPIFLSGEFEYNGERNPATLHLGHCKV